MVATTPVRILIVDDEEVQLKALCSTLEEQGFKTVGFNCPDLALKALVHSKFDLLLSDLMMPKMDGVELISEALRREPNIVGIIMTGHGTVSTAVAAMKSGALDYILKPFNLGAIMPVISRGLVVRQLRMEKTALQRRLLARTEELEIANTDLSAFNCSVSHDLRAPVRAIGGLADIFRRKHAKDVESEGQALLERIQENVNRMTALIDGLLSFANLGKHSLTRNPVDPTVIAQKVVDEISEHYAGRHLDITIDELPGCHADRLLLHQVFTNLIDNALKYTRDRNPARIQIGWRKEDDKTVYFVKDNGVGFETDYCGKLFKIFQRLHSSEEFEGSGIGLALVHRIVTRHGGQIWAESQLAQGATFNFTLGELEHV